MLVKPVQKIPLSTKKSLYHVGKTYIQAIIGTQFNTFILYTHRFIRFTSTTYTARKTTEYNNVKELCRWGKFLKQATVLRNELLSIN